MGDVTVTKPPPLVRVPNVELLQAGTWSLSSGITTFTVEDLMSAVAALDCPSVRRPVLKLGHDGNHGVGLPALGYVDNMRVADGGRTLVGDFAGMPAWLADADADGFSVLASAYPDRSTEGEFDFRCQMGHTHPFVVLAVALLGETLPGIGTLTSLQDVAALYGVEVAAQNLPEPTGTRVLVNASRKEAAMPNPRPQQVTAAVTDEDVMRAFYGSPLGQDWDHWVIRFELDPAVALIYVDDATGTYFYVPVTIGEGSGSDAVTFGEPQPREMEFVPKKAAAAAGRRPIVFASKAESRPAASSGPPSSTAAPAAEAAPSGTTPKGAGMDPAKLREALGLPADASDIEVSAALAATGLPVAPTEATAPAGDAPAGDPPATGAPPAAPVAASVPAGMKLVPDEAWQEMQASASRGNEAHEKLRVQERDTYLLAAAREGRVPPGKGFDSFRNWYDRDATACRAEVDQTPKNTYAPVAAVGHDGGGEPTDTDPAAGDDYWFPGVTTVRQEG